MSCACFTVSNPIWRPVFFLYSSRREAELVGKQAEGQKRAIELSLSALRSQEEEACLSLQRVKEEVQQHKQQLHKLKSEQKKREKQALKYVTQCTSMYVCISAGCALH